ncbi:oxidoreductase [uncultured Pseudoalteromonas sp.]|uniref:oxidoreductase n=1 Tax=uncultured Pseudoalteromonas sp. TaxID=114053 RepID=UPI0030D7F966|tara:strand:- start:5275 stop:6051 length:777 start_codon:yes stop_codon:yes gene_type:complete
MSQSLEDKVIVLTGACGLLGQHFTTDLVEHGGIVIIADVNQAMGLQLSAQINDQHPAKSEFVYFDICRKSSINEALAFIDKKYGKIDALINNAYPRNENYGRKFFDVEYDDFCQNLNMNLGGYFLTSQQLAKYFIKQGYGNIINIASVYGVIAPKLELYENTEMTMPVEYAAIKSALIHLTKYMAKQLKGNNIRVNSLSPGGILDSQPDKFLARYKKLCLSKGMLNPADISGSLRYLLADESRYVNGQNIIVDDGFTL